MNWDFKLFSSLCICNRMNKRKKELHALTSLYLYNIVFIRKFPVLGCSRKIELAKAADSNSLAQHPFTLQHNEFMVEFIQGYTLQKMKREIGGRRLI